MESESTWHILPNDMLVVILAHLQAKEIIPLATVSKQFCICTSDNTLWKHKFTQEYDRKAIKSMSGRALEAETAFQELLKSDHPEHYVLNDWKRGYIMKVIGQTTHERFQCFSNCLANISQGYPLLNGHDIPYQVHIPRVIEPVLPLKIERIYSKREVRNQKVGPIDQYKNDKGTQLFKKIVAESTPEQLNLMWLVVNGAKHPEILPQIQQSNAPSISLFGKWFNHTNSTNFPFLVKFDGDLQLTEWLFTHCYERSAIYVMIIAPTIAEYAAKQWYLQSYEPMTALLVYLKNHIAKLFSVDRKSFCWPYDALTLYSICRSFDAAFTEQLFYTVLQNGQQDITGRVPVVDSFMIFGNDFSLGELPHETVTLSRDQPLSNSANHPALSANELEHAFLHYKKERQCFVHGAESLGAALQGLSAEAQHAYQLRVLRAVQQCQATAFMKEFYHLIGQFGEFWEDPECQSIMAKSDFSLAVLGELTTKLSAPKN